MSEIAVVSSRRPAAAARGGGRRGCRRGAAAGQWARRLPVGRSSRINLIGILVSAYGGATLAGNLSGAFQSGGLRFGVVDMDERRVDKVLITPIVGQTPARSPEKLSGVDSELP